MLPDGLSHKTPIPADFEGRDSSGRTKVNKYAYQGITAKYILAGQKKGGT